MIQDATSEYQEEVLNCALALKTLKESNRIAKLALNLDKDQEEFMEDVHKTYEALNEQAKKENDVQEDEDTDGYVESNQELMTAIEMIVSTLALLASEHRTMKSTISVHEQAIKTLLQSKL